MFRYAILLLIPACLANWTKDMEKSGLFEGDIMLNPEQQENLKNGEYPFALTKKNLWGQTIPYEIGRDLQRQTKAMIAINQAIADYHEYTCLRFVKRTTERAYLHFYDSGGGCFSAVGKQGGFQKISLSSGCWFKGTAIHEIMHALGVYHEQSRPDRDSHVRIHWENIPDRLEYNFKKKPVDLIDSLGEPYDYRSIMHYGKNAFGGSKITIETIDPDYQNIIGSRAGFSRSDVTQLNKLYKCPPTTATFPPTASNTCFDEHSICPDMARQGNCNVPKWKQYMHSKCKLSCGLCGSNTKPPTPATDGPTRPTVRPTRGPIITSRPITQGPGRCRDVYISHCKIFKETGACTKDNWQSYVKKFCRKSCGFCT